MSVRRGSTRGQALVEFSIAVGVLLVILMGLVDFGQALYKYNAVSQAAREITRVTSVHPGSPLGSSLETAAVIATQKGLIPGLADPQFACVDPVTTTTVGDCSYLKDYLVKVTITAPYTPVTPLLGLTGTWNLQGTSSAAIQ